MSRVVERAYEHDDLAAVRVVFTDGTTRLVPYATVSAWVYDLGAGDDGSIQPVLRAIVGKALDEKGELTNG